VIIESIVTSMDPSGTVNFAPMGVEWGEDHLVLKPFLETTTFRNVSATRTAVVNLTDNVMLFAQAAISSPSYPAFPAEVVRGVVLEAACSWTPPRHARGSRRVSSTMASGGSFSASIALGTPCWRPRSSRPGHI
jgi:hypothetical protein